jgi:hypothetical protein
MHTRCPAPKADVMLPRCSRQKEAGIFGVFAHGNRMNETET